jgi:two-component system, NarL family, response regulator DesR
VARALAEPTGPGERDPEPQRVDGVIRVLLVVRRRLFREALAAVLSAEEDLQVDAAVVRAREATAVAGATRPDVIVADIDMLAGPAVGAVEPYETLPDYAVLVLADADSPAAVRAMLDTRVRGFVDKDAAPGSLAPKIRRIHKGERVIDPTLAVAALSAPRNPLTGRERDVLRAAASGAPAEEIARRLHLTTGTVRNYMSKTIRKTGARNRSEAVRIAEEHGWL